MTRRCGIAIVIALLWASAPAQAQDTRGAGRIEIDTAIFGGGTLIVPSAVPGIGRTDSYVVSGAVTGNLNRWFGIEGEIGWAMGHRRAHQLYGVIPPGTHAPNVLLYSGNLVYNPFASNRPLVPYVRAGVGGLTTFDVLPGSTFGLPGDRTLLTLGGGGGIRWFPIQHWGVRGDYFAMHIRSEPPPPGALRRHVHGAHRFYGALVLTF